MCLKLICPLTLCIHALPQGSRAWRLSTPPHPPPPGTAGQGPGLSEDRGRGRSSHSATVQHLHGQLGGTRAHKPSPVGGPGRRLQGGRFRQPLRSLPQPPTAVTAEHPKALRALHPPPRLAPTPTPPEAMGSLTQPALETGCNPPPRADPPLGPPCSAWAWGGEGPSTPSQCPRSPGRWTGDRAMDKPRPGSTLRQGTNADACC